MVAAKQHARSYKDYITGQRTRTIGKKSIKGRLDCCYKCKRIFCSSFCNEECGTGECALYCNSIQREGKLLDERIHIDPDVLLNFTGNAYEIVHFVRDILQVPYRSEDKTITELKGWMTYDLDGIERRVKTTKEDNNTYIWITGRRAQ